MIIPTRRNSATPADKLVAGTELAPLQIQIYAVRVSGKQMTASLFRQLPIVKLCDEEGNKRSELTYWGVVRHESKEGSNWMLLLEDNRLARAGINAHLKSDATYADRIASCRKMIDLMSDSKTKAYYAQEIVNSQQEHRVEPIRYKTHFDASMYPQLFIGV